MVVLDMETLQEILPDDQNGNSHRIEMLEESVYPRLMFERRYEQVRNIIGNWIAPPMVSQ